MNNFVLYNPTKLIFGRDTINSIGVEAASANVKKIFILGGGGSAKANGVYETAKESLLRAGIEIVEFWGVSPNPILKHTIEAIELCRLHQVDAILALGGGSVIDEAKSVAAGFYLDNIWDAFERKAHITKALPLFTILTISGTGSEMNPFAVLTNEVEKKKWNIGAPVLYPKATIIDPSVQMSLPWNQTVNGGIDAISHTLEYYFSGKLQETAISIGEAIISSVIKSLDALQINPQDYEARANLAWAATLALNGIAGSSLLGEWSAHRIEHGISAIYPNVAHGAGLAIVFPAWIAYTSGTNPEQYLRFARNIWGVDSVDEGISRMKEKYASWGAPTNLRDIDVPEDMIEPIADNASKLGTVGSLMPLTKKEMAEILRIAY